MNSIQVEFLKGFSKLLKKYEIDQVYSDNESIFFRQALKSCLLIAGIKRKSYM